MYSQTGWRLKRARAFCERGQAEGLDSCLTNALAAAMLALLAVLAGSFRCRLLARSEDGSARAACGSNLSAPCEHLLAHPSRWASSARASVQSFCRTCTTGGSRAEVRLAVHMH